MKIGELLTEDRVHVPMTAGNVARAVALLRGRSREGAPEGEVQGPLDAGAEEALDRLNRGRGGRLRIASRQAIVVIVEGAEQDRVKIGISPEPLPGFPPPTRSGDGLRMGREIPWREAPGAPSRGPRIVVLIERSGDSRIRDDGVGRLIALLATPEVESRLLGATRPEDVPAISALTDLTLSGSLRVSDALVPTSYRVFPETPVDEVLDLMARKGVPAVAVVGESLQVVGILTAGDGLRLFLARGNKPDVLTREVMTRAVLCVTEDQELADAARTMVTRNLRQLPVTRDGEMVGFLTRESVLRTLYGSGLRPRGSGGG
ncbi:MAG: CBS domain-containing protein [Gemmatimonadales bacterium]|nr:MAG: CBS domain-containing protein [Gemmatimonadales bacterium]